MSDKGMTRRSFLGLLGMGAAAAIVLPKLAYTAKAAPAINGPGQVGNALVTDGWTSGATLLRGDVFTINGVYSVNPLTGRETGRLQTFVVTADATALGGAAALRIAPAILVRGPLRNVGQAPRHGARLTPWFAPKTEATTAWASNDLSIPNWYMDKGLS